MNWWKREALPNCTARVDKSPCGRISLTIRGISVIYITGDMHGDRSRFSMKEIKRLKKGDSLIICGDFGFLWDGSRKERRFLKWLGRRRYHVLFVDGCHENFPLLAETEPERWNGGMTRPITGRLRQLLRGEVFELEGKRFFAFGGGQSVDNELREAGKTWWKEEAPTEDDMQNGLSNLRECGFKVDYIVTHEPPAVVKEFLDMNTLERARINTYLNEVQQQCTFTRWYFGKCHVNKMIPPKYHALFEQVAAIGK